MRNPRNTVVVSIGSGEGAAKVREMFTSIAEQEFGSNQSRLLGDMARELVVAFRVDDVATAEKLGLFREAVMGPHICQRVVNAYNAKLRKIRDQYLSSSQIVPPGAPTEKAE